MSPLAGLFFLILAERVEPRAHAEFGESALF